MVLNTSPEIPPCAQVVLNEENSLVYYILNLVSEEKAGKLFHVLVEKIPWRQQMDIYGPLDRLTYYMSDATAVFQYLDIREEANPWLPEVKEIRDKLSMMLGVPLTACLLNNYEEGVGFIPWHYDEMRAHGKHKTVATVSLGSERPFEMKHRENPENRVRLFLDPGSALVMQGDTQDHWMHQVPLEPDFSGPRISLTFRSIVPGYEDALSEEERRNFAPCK